MRRHSTKCECKRRPSAGFEKIASHSKAKLDCLSFKSRVFIASIKPHSVVRLFTGSRLAPSDGGMFCCGSQLGANSIRAAPLKLFRATSEKGRDNHHSLLPSPRIPRFNVTRLSPTWGIRQDSTGASLPADIFRWLNSPSLSRRPTLWGKLAAALTAALHCHRAPHDIAFIFTGRRSGIQEEVMQTDGHSLLDGTVFF